jgi:4-hydroxy-tetrahydrodipicolinate synthase
MQIDGVWLPIITPFLDDKIDLISYQRMINHYIEEGISGLMPLGTTGESPTVTDEEFEQLIAKTMEYADNRVPVFIGLGGNDTKKVMKKLKIVEWYQVAGILSVSPYYNRPDQRGIYEHFLRISEATDLDIILYNIPYRTGRNVENETLYRLAELKNIIGLKDASGDIKQTMELLRQPPANFSILTGEDIFFYLTLVLGGQGGILASAHLNTRKFIDIYDKVKKNDHQAALAVWEKIASIIPLLFEEPNPSPIKYCLEKLGLIHSAETRLPLMPISDTLQKKLDDLLL